MNNSLFLTPTSSSFLFSLHPTYTHKLPTHPRHEELKKEKVASSRLKKKDHLALMMELLGMMPRKIALGGRYSRDFFNRYGDLRHIRRLRFWPLNKVLTEKYEFSEQDANDIADFLVPILDFVPEKRPTAAQCLTHPWINAGPRLREPSIASLPKATDGGVSEKRERDEREAMEVGVGNIAIDGPSKSDKEPQSIQKLQKQS
ncbi:SRSF protein kinase 1 [Vitis vinifera]|uniref:non-specific serine/threonine protein kinase n=1 Tax=Vitis vinifera TaxID=29760 RepID=A0A438F355_VITVI|nr:SRSF protein kinase 1 [Vitis vinifera]